MHSNLTASELLPLFLQIDGEKACATLLVLLRALKIVGSPRWMQIDGAFRPFLKSES